MNNDSTITYRVTTSGIEEAEAKFNRLGATIKNVTINQNGSVTATGALSKAQAQLAESTGEAANQTAKAAKSHSNYIAHIAKTTILSASVNAAFQSIAESAGDAITQVDLFSNFPASMAALGLSASDATVSLGKLRDYAAQTGISLTEATQSVTRFAEITKDVKAATVEFIGVKNALIAGGAPALQQKQALEQLTQAYARGRPQLIEFRSLQTAMPAQLTAVAKALKLPNTQELGNQLTHGKISMQTFMTELTKLGTSGEIYQQAQARMSGIAFSAGVMKQALTNGIAQIVQAVGRQNIIAFFKFLTQVIIVATTFVVAFINAMISLFNIVSKVFGGPQLKHFSGDMASTADAAGSAADHASDLADATGDAADAAKDYNKSLAGFDKMNVLPDKTGGKTKDSPISGQNGLDPATAGLLDNMFGNLNTNIQEASKWAKIFAGILGGLAANAAFAKLFGINPLKELVKGLADATKGAFGFGQELDKNGKTLDKQGNKIGQSFGDKIGKGLGDSASKLGPAIAGFAGTVAGFLAEAFTTTVLPAIATALAPIGTAIAGVFTGLAVILGIPVEAVIALVVAAVAIIIGIIYLIATNWDTIVNFMKGVWDAFVGFITAVWNTLYDILAGPIKFILQFIEAVVILIVAIVATLIEVIVKLVVGFLVLLFNVLSAIGGWIYDNVIKPVADFFVGLWNGVVAAVTAAWNWIFNNVLAPIGNWINTNVIQPVLRFFKGLWDTVSGFVSNFVSGVFNFLAPFGQWIYDHVIAPVAGFFSGLWNGIKQGLSNLFDGIRNIFGSLGGIIKTPINGVIGLINDVLKQLNKVKVPDWVPGLGGKGVNFPMIPMLAKGGVVNQATMAIIGESGSEAVMPLENNTEWIDTLAAKLNNQMGSGQPVQLVVQVGEDKIVNKVVDLINEKTNMSGRNVIYV